MSGNPESSAKAPLLIASRKARPNQSENARNLQTALLQRIARRTQATVSEHTGLDKSVVCRIVAGERGVMLDELYDFLEVLGLAVIECDGEVISLPEEEVDALRVLARKSLGGL